MNCPDKSAPWKVATVGIWALFFLTSCYCAWRTAGYLGQPVGLALTILAWVAFAPLVALIICSWGRLALLAVVVAPVMGIELWLAAFHRASLNAHTLTLIVGTDSSEVSHWLRQGWVWLAVASSGLVILCVAAWRLQGVVRLSGLMRLRLVTPAIAGLCAFIGVVLVVVPEEITPRNGDVVGLHWRMAERVFPWGVPLRLVSFALERNQFLEQRERTQAFRWQARGDAEPRIVVLVIGESARASSFQLGGYPRETTPLLMQTPGVVWMHDYAANAVMTAESVPLMITRRAVGQRMTEFSERSLVSAFGEAGYATYWISNQATAGVHDMVIASYAQEAKHRYFLNAATHETAGAFDRELLPQVDAAITAEPDKLMLVVHLMGSHFAYEDRYPEADAYFPSTGNEAQRWRNAYDNSIRETDRVLAGLIARLSRDARPSALIFASDHGELLPESGCEKRWHGHGAREDVRAAALVWLSAHPQNAPKHRALVRNATRPTSGKDVLASLFDVGELRVPNSSKAQSASWFSPAYSTRARRVQTLSGLADPDAVGEGACGVFPLAKESGKK